MLKAYNKLVRDNIPALIRKDGDVPKIRILESDKELLKAALAKVIEEAKELKSAENVEDAIDEIADLREILDLVMRLLNISGFQVSRARARRMRLRGRFDDRIFLESVESRKKTKARR